MFKNFFSKSINKIKEVFSHKELSIGRKLLALFQKGLSPETISQIEELLYSSDLGSVITSKLIQDISQYHYANPSASSEDLTYFIKEKCLAYFKTEFSDDLKGSPHVIFVIGSNGYGKTTSVAKLANYYKKKGIKPLLVAADTFRAAATEQLQLWAKRLEVEIVSGKMGADPAAVIFDGIQAAIKREYQIVIIDTAGRLHTKEPLLKELEKLYRTAGKVLPGAPHETLLVLDATTGRTAISQAQAFMKYAPITSLFLSKFDSSSKAGSIISLESELNLPTKWLGIGETADDLIPFNATEFVDALLRDV